MLNTCAQQFVDLLGSRDLDFKSGTDKDGDSVVEFPYKGKVAKLFFCGETGQYLSIYLVYESVSKDKRMEAIVACNELNCQYKWFTFYVDRDNDVVVHDDAILSVDDEGEEAFELLLRMLKIGDDVKPTLMKAIYA